MKRVEVTWRDSTSMGRWTRKDTAIQETHEGGYLDCRSAGYLLEDTPDQVTLVLSVTADENDVNHMLTIPREAVTKIVTLRATKG